MKTLSDTGSESEKDKSWPSLVPLGSHKWQTLNVGPRCIILDPQSALISLKLFCCPSGHQAGLTHLMFCVIDNGKFLVQSKDKKDIECSSPL